MEDINKDAIEVEPLKVCAVCSNRLVGRQTKFCSAACREKDHYARKKTISKVCEYCGRDYMAASNTQLYCSPSCAASHGNLGKKGEAARNWKGGLIHGANGYVRMYMPGHPMAHKDGYAYQHRVIAQTKYPIRLPSDYPVHHVNGVKDDNRPENLKASPSQSEHMVRYHHKPA